MALRCKHKERLEHKEVFPSAWEQMTPDERANVEPAPWMFRQEAHLIFICDLCGRRKTQVLKPTERM